MCTVLSACLSASLSNVYCMSACLSVSLSNVYCMSACLSVSPFVSMYCVSVHPPVCKSVCQSLLGPYIKYINPSPASSILYYSFIVIDSILFFYCYRFYSILLLLSFCIGDAVLTRGFFSPLFICSPHCPSPLLLWR